MELLVVRCLRRDPAAARQLVRMFEPALLYYVRRIVGSEADAWDVLQETWMRVFRTLGQLKDTRAFPAYLYTTARHRAVAHLRSATAREALLASIDPPAELDEAISDAEFCADDAAAVHHGLEKISLPHREVLTLFFLEELSVAEIAAVVGVPPGTVKSRLHHARRALRAILEENPSVEGASDAH